jgi:hypothetical protein
LEVQNHQKSKLIDTKQTHIISAQQTDTKLKVAEIDKKIADLEKNLAKLRSERFHNFIFHAFLFQIFLLIFPEKV